MLAGMNKVDQTKMNHSVDGDSDLHTTRTHKYIILAGPAIHRM